MKKNQLRDQQKAHYDLKQSIFSPEFKQSNYYYSDHLKSVAAVINSLTRPSDKVLEIGCGDGLESNFVNRKKLVVTDLSLKRCHSRHSSFEFDISDQKQVSKVLKKYGRFDLIYEIYTLHHLPDMDECLKSFKKLGKTVVIIEPVVWTPQTLILTVLTNLKNEPHYFEMTKGNLDRMLGTHFKEVNRLTLYGRFHYIFALLPSFLVNIFKPIYQLTTLPKCNVYVCR
jgi:2-polyprenyl-3-methyl-5-hydroxy-6-metoxy-1,4-benzoquinol methylase